MTVAVSMPLGYVPGTDLHAIRELKAAEYVKTCQRLAASIRRGKIVTDPGFEKFRELWQNLENAIDVAEIHEREVRFRAPTVPIDPGSVRAFERAGRAVIGQGDV